MSRYFQYFPQVTHTSEKLTDITKRAKFYEKIQSDPYVFLPYTIEEGLRADQVAYYYYGDANLVWLVYLANNIIDPYYDWPLTSEELYDMIAKKYESQAGTKGLDVAKWASDTNITDNILYYYSVDDSELRISKDSYALSVSLDASFEADKWLAYRYFDYELEKNENRRIIQLVDNRFTAKIEKEFKSIMNG